MNTAFSKSFIIESFGKKGGIIGRNLYIDDSVIEALRRYAVDLEKEILEREDGDFLEFRVLRTDDVNDIILGFRLSKPIIPGQTRFTTKVYRVLRFYPHDEPADQFWFDLENY